jgi:hypothetical protein
MPRHAVGLIEHLRASHCKPWRDATNEERLNRENGLLLTPSIDHLFERGAIFVRPAKVPRIFIGVRLAAVAIHRVHRRFASSAAPSTKLRRWGEERATAGYNGNGTLEREHWRGIARNHDTHIRSRCVVKIHVQTSR